MRLALTVVLCAFLLGASAGPRGGSERDRPGGRPPSGRRPDESVRGDSQSESGASPEESIETDSVESDAGREEAPQAPPVAETRPVPGLERPARPQEPPKDERPKPTRPLKSPGDRPSRRPTPGGRGPEEVPGGPRPGEGDDGVWIQNGGEGSKRPTRPETVDSGDKFVLYMPVVCAAHADCQEWRDGAMCDGTATIDGTDSQVCTPPPKPKCPCRVTRSGDTDETKFERGCRLNPDDPAVTPCPAADNTLAVKFNQFDGSFTYCEAPPSDPAEVFSHKCRLG